MYATEIKWMEMFLDKVRTPWLNPIFVVCDHLDSVWLVLILAAVIYHLFNRKEGLNFLFILVVSGVCNHLLKELFALPRPCQLAPIGLICPTSYGFPSGAGQTSAVIAGFALIRCPHKVGKIIAVIFGLFLSFSRIYLGVHFFTDILAGLAVGSAILWVCLQILPFIEKRWPFLMLLLGVGGLLFGEVSKLSHILLIFGLAVGGFLSKNGRIQAKWLWRSFSLLFSFVGVGVFYYLSTLSHTYHPVAMFCIGLWVFFLSSWIVDKVVPSS